MINQKGQIQQIWEYPVNSDIDYMLSGFYTSPIFFSNQKLITRRVPRYNPFYEKEKYFSMPPELMLDLNGDDKMPKSVGGWPEKYLKLNYYNDYPSRCVITEENKKREVLMYSFPSEKELYLYENDKFLCKKMAKSKFIDTSYLFHDDSIGNIAYTMKYIITKPRYGKVYYDKYRKLIYRIAFHEIEYLNEDGLTVKELLDKPWSLIVLDKQYNVLGEKKFDPSVYKYGPIYVSEKGILIPKRESVNNTGKYVQTYSVFKVGL